MAKKRTPFFGRGVEQSRATHMQTLLVELNSGFNTIISQHVVSKPLTLSFSTPYVTGYLTSSLTGPSRCEWETPSLWALALSSLWFKSISVHPDDSWLQYIFTTSHIVRYAYHTTVVDLIRDNNIAAYRLWSN